MACGGKDLGNVFQIPDLWSPSKLLVDASATKSILFSELHVKVKEIDTNLPFLLTNAHDQNIFQLPRLSFESLDPSSQPTQITDVSESTHTTGNDEADHDDIWLSSEEIQRRTISHYTWNGFYNSDDEFVTTPYITEAGSAIFDAAISAPEDYLGIANDDCFVVHFKVYFSSLLALGFGRSSVLFTWNDEEHTFIQVIPRLRIPGYTADALVGVMAMFMECGMITKSLQKYIDKTYSGETSPGRVALADSVSILLRTIQTQLGEPASKEMSLIKLQILFKPAHSMLICFQQLVHNTAANRSDESLLSTIFEEIQILEHTTDTLRRILLAILVRASQPWLEFASEWLGLKPETGLPITKDGKGKGLVRLANSEWIDDQGVEKTEPDYLLDLDKIPSFIASNDARAMFEVGKSLRFLRAHHPDHPLSRAEVVAASNPPFLKWNFSWHDIFQVESRALQYEKDLKSALRNSSRNSSHTRAPMNYIGPRSDSFHLNIFGISPSDLEAHILASVAMLDKPLQDINPQDNLSICLKAHLASSEESEEHEKQSFEPAISLTPALSFNPIISAQARIVNGTCMKILFKCHNLREHLSLQKSFYLFGNGVFISRLSHVLFDPDLESAERRNGVAFSGGVMGLRLDRRDTWPPASSELRLILTGVLAESYFNNQSYDRSRGTRYPAQKSLPGDLSFAVRDMSQKEIDECMNPDGLKALDFLRLSYKPPRPLTTIINSLILFKYDQIFKFLLRLIRMLYVLSSLFRNSSIRGSPQQGKNITTQRFRIEAHHFVSSVSGYFFDTGINTTWRIFEAKLDQIEKQLNTEDDVSMGANEGLDKLRDYHERVLDRIMFALLLRKRQQPVLHLLEDIFGLILKFSKLAQDTSDVGRNGNMEEEIRVTYGSFRRKVAIFITVLRGLSEKKGYAGKWSPEAGGELSSGMLAGTDLVEENTITQLLTRLETSDSHEIG
ncbi:hypothetical protein K3495_g5783 [Podosphaera aphanis]|nr:hypothetical protein K3495_g5783 [Podosphaera aphanis]